MWKLSSPDNKTCITITENNNQELFYCVIHNENTVIEESNLGFESDLCNFTKEFRFIKEERSIINETYSLPAGKKSLYENYANEMILSFACGKEQFDLYLRAYNDGVAFRYHVPSSKERPIKVLREATTFNFAEDYQDLWLQNWVSSYEGTYDHTNWEDKYGRDYGMPCLFHASQGGWSIITEAQVYNTNGSYCSCHLRGSGNRSMKLEFAPEEKGNPLSCKVPFYSPWRMIITTDNLDQLINTTMNYNLNLPTTMTDTKWIKPGRCLWAWWEYENGAQLYTEQKRYVDFAASIGFEGLTVDADWDITWLKNLCDYAHEKGLVIWLWSAMQYIDTPEKAQEKIPLWASCGVDGLKVDFFQNDSQHTMWQYEMIAKIMTEYHLMINFHGATKCMGEGRTWPNLMTAEGVMGLEHYKWSGLPNSEHNCTLPFTRNVVGPMDYTPTGFSNKNRNTTLGHQMALPVVFESGATNIAASVYYLEAWKGTDFLRRMKPVYDSIKVLSGYPGHHAAIMRKKGNEWIIGCITNKSMILRLNMDFLPEGVFDAEIYEDDSSGEMIKMKLCKVSRKDVLELPLLENGGAGIYITETVKPVPKGICSGYMSDDRKEYYAIEARTIRGSEPLIFENGQETIQLNGGVIFEVEAKAKPQTIRFFYAAKDPWILHINDGVNEIISQMPQSGSDKVFITKDIVFPFVNYNTTLWIYRDSGCVPALEKIHIINNQPAKTWYLPVEKATLKGSAELISDDEGNKKVVGLGNGSELLFENISLDKDGWYLIRFNYCAGESRDIIVELNGIDTYITNLHNTANWIFPCWNIRDEREIRVRMRAGINTIRLYNDQDRSNHLYSITIVED